VNFGVMPAAVSVWRQACVHFVVGWKVTEADEAAIAALPASAWSPAVEQDGQMQDEGVYWIV